MKENPVSSPELALWMKWQQAFIDEGFAQARRVNNLPFIWQQAQKIKKGASPSEVVYEEDRLKLLHYESPVQPRYRTPLLFVYALVNRPYILDLKRDRSVVAHFVNSGF